MRINFRYFKDGTAEARLLDSEGGKFTVESAYMLFAAYNGVNVNAREQRSVLQRGLDLSQRGRDGRGDGRSRRVREFEASRVVEADERRDRIAAIGARQTAEETAAWHAFLRGGRGALTDEQRAQSFATDSGGG